jgi:hypothetical protein
MHLRLPRLIIPNGVRREEGRGRERRGRWRGGERREEEGGGGKRERRGRVDDLVALAKAAWGVLMHFRLPRLIIPNGLGRGGEKGKEKRRRREEEGGGE